MSYFDPNDGLIDGGDAPREDIADRMYKRIHEDSYQQPKTKPKGMTRPPIALTCYLCGQQFGTASLEIHQKQCFTKKLLQWERGDPETRGPKPVLRTDQPRNDNGDDINRSGGQNYAAMSAREVEKFNNNQFQEFQESALVPCENCGRTFFPDRLQVHLRSCKPGASARPVRKAGEAGSPTEYKQSIKRASSGADYRSRSESVEPSFPKEPLAKESKDSPSNGFSDGYEERRNIESKSTTPNGTSVPTPSTGAHRLSIPVIPHLQLGTQRDDYGDVDDNDRQDDDGFHSVGSQDIPAEGEALDEGFEDNPAPPPRKPKVAIDRPLDLSHVQSRFKTASVTNLERCQFCKRTFAPDRLARHEEVCIEKKTMKTGPIGMTPRVGGKIIEPVIRPASSSGVARSGAATSRVSGVGPLARDNGPMTTRGGPSGGTKPTTIIRPANASSRPQSPTVNRQPSRSPPPGQRSSIDRGGANHDRAGTKPSSSSARPMSPSPTTRAEEHRPKFCTECGHKLYSATQKFCGECGFPVTTA